MRSGRTAVSCPAARIDGLLVQQVQDETVVYDLQTKDAHCLKPLAAVVFTLADGRTSVDDIAALAGERLGESVSSTDVRGAIAQLEERALLKTPLVVHNGMSRRDLVHKATLAGAATAFAGPLISSIVAPTAAMAASGIATGCSGCGKNSDCVSNHCCQSNAGKDCSQGCCVGGNNSCHFCNCVGSNCQCTVTPADAGIPQCPCICGTGGCVGVPCCVTVNALCCTTAPAC